MKNPYKIILAASALCLLSLAPAHAGRHLKGAITVSAPVVTLADVFEGDAADPSWAGVVVAQSPSPGRQLVVRSAHIVETARSAGAMWDSATTSPSIVITRRGVTVPTDVIAKEIAAALPADKRTSNITLNPGAAGIAVATASDFAAVKVTRLQYDARSESFNATLSYPDGKGGKQSDVITGRIVAMIDVPVLNTTLAPGAAISAQDIDWLSLPARQVNGNMIANADDAIGMAARRALRPGVPLRLSDIERPRLVKRGDIVTMTLTKPGVALTATGRAMENGAKGDRIRLVNTASNRSVEGIVVSDRQVMVTTGMQVVAQYD